MTRALRSLSLAVVCLFTCLPPAAATTPEAAPSSSCGWGYTGPTAPNEWWRICYPSNFVCAMGPRQSPIDLPTAKAVVRAPLPPLRFLYETRPATVVNNGHAVQAAFGNGPSLALEAAGQRFELFELHFHTPGEHLVNGQAAPMEVHLVHAGPAGTLAVVGVLVREGAANPVLQRIWEAIGKGPIPLDATALLPAGRRGYSYSGSLTTPPCTEGVSWYVLQEGIELSGKQLQDFRSLFPEGNARPVQPLNGRPVVGVN